MFLNFFKAKFANEFLQHFLNKCKIQNKEPTQLEIKYLELISEFYLMTESSDTFYNSKAGCETILADLDSLDYLRLPLATRGYVYFYKSELNIKLENYSVAISNLDHFLNSTEYRSFVPAVISKARCYIELESFNTGIGVLTSALNNLKENIKAYSQITRITNEYLKLINIKSNDVLTLKVGFVKAVIQMQEDSIRHKGISEVIKEGQEMVSSKNPYLVLPLYNTNKNSKATQKSTIANNIKAEMHTANTIEKIIDKKQSYKVKLIVPKSKNTIIYPELKEKDSKETIRVENKEVEALDNRLSNIIKIDESGSEDDSNELMGSKLIGLVLSCKLEVESLLSKLLKIILKH